MASRSAVQHRMGAWTRRTESPADSAAVRTSSHRDGWERMSASQFHSRGTAAASQQRVSLRAAMTRALADAILSTLFAGSPAGEPVVGPLRGNVTEYYRLENSCLFSLFRDRTGIPITLATAFCCVGEAAGLRGAQARARTQRIILAALQLDAQLAEARVPAVLGDVVEEVVDHVGRSGSSRQGRVIGQW